MTADDKILSEVCTLRAKVLRDGDDIKSLSKQLEGARSEALEEAAAWHDAQAKEAIEQSERCKELAPVSSHNYRNLSREHECYAKAIRALKGKS